MLMQKKSSNWAWVPPLYFIEGLPNAIVASLSVGYYMSMGVGNAKAAMLTSGLYLPWFLKGLWGPFVDSVSTKRKWIFFCTALFAVCFAGLALAGFFPRWIAASALMFWTLGFASATFDIAADGFYMLALDDKSQSFFVGIRNAFYRIAVLFGQGAMLVIAGYFGKFFFVTIQIDGYFLGSGVPHVRCSVFHCSGLFLKSSPAPSNRRAARGFFGGGNRAQYALGVRGVLF